jgi:DNA polymerase
VIVRLFIIGFLAACWSTDRSREGGRGNAADYPPSDAGIDREPMHAPEPNDARPFLPERRSLAAMREAARSCRGCHLWRDATQTVFGEGLRRARLVLVGEMAGDREDLAGTPFVGPAGRELDRALTALGIDRREAYVTNVVKHFKFEYRGKRRIHKKPGRLEVAACKPWLDGELDLIRPDAVALLGATAAQALIDPGFRLRADRGRLLESNLAPLVLATIHPSAILRAPDDRARQEERRAFTADLGTLWQALSETG